MTGENKLAIGYCKGFRKNDTRKKKKCKDAPLKNTLD